MNTTLKPWAAALVAAHLCVPAWAADDATELKSEADRVSYAIGYQVGGDMKQVHVDLNAAAVTRGIADAQKGTARLMDEEAMRTTLTNLKQRVDAQDRAAGPQIVGEAAAASDAKAPSAAAHAQRMAPQGTDESKAFLAENAKKAGVVTLPSGLQYEVLKSGNGRQPKQGDKVALTYRGSLISGTEFGGTPQGKDATRTFAVDALVPGLKEAVSHMKEGDEWRVYVPPQLGFDARTPLFRKVTVFDIRLASVSSN